MVSAFQPTMVGKGKGSCMVGREAIRNGGGFAGRAGRICSVNGLPKLRSSGSPRTRYCTSCDVLSAPSPSGPDHTSGNAGGFGKPDR